MKMKFFSFMLVFFLALSARASIPHDNFFGVQKHGLTLNTAIEVRSGDDITVSGSFYGDVIEFKLYFDNLDTKRRYIQVFPMSSTDVLTLFNGFSIGTKVPFEPGLYFVRVRTIFRGGKVSPLSTPLFLIIKSANYKQPLPTLDTIFSVSDIMRMLKGQ